jgi:hypothetical protein
VVGRVAHPTQSGSKYKKAQSAVFMACRQSPNIALDRKNAGEINAAIAFILQANLATNGRRSRGLLRCAEDFKRRILIRRSMNGIALDQITGKPTHDSSRSPQASDAAPKSESLLASKDENVHGAADENPPIKHHRAAAIFASAGHATQERGPSARGSSNARAEGPRSLRVVSLRSTDWLG